MKKLLKNFAALFVALMLVSFASGQSKNEALTTSSGFTNDGAKSSINGFTVYEANQDNYVVANPVLTQAMVNNWSDAAKASSLGTIDNYFSSVNFDATSKKLSVIVKEGREFDLNSVTNILGTFIANSKGALPDSKK